MHFIRFVTLFLLGLNMCFAAQTVNEPVPWPPAWVGDANADGTSVEGVNQDDHSGFDYGKDSYGYWSNFEIINGGVIVATVEMRYIQPENFEMGAPINEQGAKRHEMSPLSTSTNKRKSVGKNDLNGGQPFWVSAEECSQNLWEEVHKLSVPGFAMKLRQFNDSDITDVDTASFPIKTPNGADNDLFTTQGYIIDRGDVDDDDVGDWRTAVEANFQNAFDAYKKIRAVESQTFAESKDFCATELKSAIESSAGITLGSVPRLPTEKEWEFVCRAGTQTAFWTGRLLKGVSVDSSLVSIVNTDFFFNFDRDDIEARIMELPGGDGGRNPEWHTVYGNGWSEAYESLTPGQMDVAGRANMKNPYYTVGGLLTVSGGASAVQGAANFDERYQHRYKADYYGDLTPILMVYVNDGNTNNVHDYKQDPYAATDASGRPTGPNRYYRLLKDDQVIVAGDFVSCSLLNASNTRINQRFAENGNILQEGTHIGDWYLGEQLEYREMVPVYARFNSTGVERKGGEFIKDEHGTLYPIRSRYAKIAYWNGGVESGSTWPPRSVNDGMERDIRNSDLSAVGKPAMSTDDYVQAIIDTCGNSDFFPDILPVGDWFSGQTAYTIVDIDGNNIDVTLTEFVMNPTANLFHDEVEIKYVSTPSAVFPALNPNPWGLRNVHGNVAEWTTTLWDGKSNHDNHAVGVFQICKGGSWKYGADLCRSAARDARDPAQAYDDVGFRFIINN